MTSLSSLPACASAPPPPCKEPEAAQSPPAPAPAKASLDERKNQVLKAERAFAKTMADRDFNAFTTFLADEAIFFTDQTTVHRGKKEIAEAWKGLFEKPQAPFSWAPERVEVIESGTLAISTGPIHNAEGKKIAVFNSIWRLESDGQWKVIFDKGGNVCDE